MKAPILCLALALIIVVLSITAIAQSTPAPPATPSAFNPEQLIEHPEATLALVTRWVEIIGSIAALLAGLVIKIMADISNVKATQKQHADNHNALTATVANIALQTPPAGPPANSQSSTIGLIAILCLILLPGCATSDLQSSQPLITTAAMFTTTDVLDKVKDDDRRRKDADYVYSVAIGVRTLMGKNPTQDELAATLKTFSAPNDPQLTELIASLSDLYGGYLQKYTASNVKLQTVNAILESIAEGAEKGAAFYR